MQPYELLVTAVSERADLFRQTLDSLLAQVDQQPARIIVHEDVRAGSTPGNIGQWLTEAKTGGRIPDFLHKVRTPAGGLGPAMAWCFAEAKTPLVLYAQEDWLTVRPVPVSACMALMEKHNLHHVRFNKRKTMRAKHADTPNPWHKVEVEFAGDETRQVLCVSDHWYTQLSLWRAGLVRDVLATCALKAPQANAFVAAVNHAMNMKFIGDPALAMDQQQRHVKMRTYIWGPIGEPAFIKHLGSVRTTGPIVHVNEIKGIR